MYLPLERGREGEKQQWVKNTLLPLAPPPTPNVGPGGQPRINCRPFGSLPSNQSIELHQPGLLFDLANPLLEI